MIIIIIIKINKVKVHAKYILLKMIAVILSTLKLKMYQ